MPNYILLVGIIFLLILPCLQRKFEKGSWSLFSVFKHFFLTWTTESQDGWGRKGSLEVKPEANPTAQTGTSGASCPGSSPDGFWVSPKMEIPPRLWASCASDPHSKKVFPDVSFCAHCLWSWPWEPLEKPGSILCAPSLYIFTGVDETLFSSSGWAVPALTDILRGVVL